MTKKTLFAALLSLSLLAPALNFAATTVESSPKVAATQNLMVNINKADVKTLTRLKDIGQKRAEKIVAYRAKNGPFKSVTDLSKIKGISARLVNDNKGHIEI